MITRPTSLAAVLCVVAALTAAACQKVPLLAPSGSTITLTASNTAIGANGTVELIAQLLEPSGTPPHPGTHVIFTTTLGVIEPAEATTDINGRVQATFKANGTNGTAVITASSGGASTGANGGVRVAVGTAAVGRVIVNATPTSLPAGGTTLITASVVDLNGTPLGGTPVSFSTNAGNLSASSAVADANGVASVSLRTSQTATVTASVGATAPPASGGNGGAPGGGTTPPPTTGQTSGTVTVTVIPNTTVQITPPTTPPSAGLPAAFTFTVTVPTGGNAVSDVRISWGDGSSQSLGAVSGAQAASHVYQTDGTYTVTATVIDVAGISQSVSTAVTVIPVPRPTIVITPTPQTQTVGGIISVNVQITLPQGIGVINTQIDFGDGDVRQLGGATSATVQKTYNAAGGYTIEVTVRDTTNTETIGTTTVSITPVG